MGFNLWLVIFLALMPVFILFTGLSAAGGFQSSADWQVIGIVLAAAIVTGYLAKRRGDEISKETSIEAGLMKDVGIPVGGSDPGKTLPTYLLHELHPSHLGHLNQEEMVAPAFRLSFVALSEALLPAQPHPRTPCPDSDVKIEPYAGPAGGSDSLKSVAEILRREHVALEGSHVLLHQTSVPVRRHTGSSQPQTMRRN